LGHGGTDISDGFGADLSEMCRASAVGAVVNAETIPTASGVKQAARVADAPAWRFAFASGGDFQFIVTTARAARVQMNRFGLHEIGEVTKLRKLRLRLANGDIIALPTKGHRDHRRLTFAEEIDALIKGSATARIHIR
jgi:thiamine monophosphate kinase